MASEPSSSLGSHNPFRKKSSTTITTANTNPTDDPSRGPGSASTEPTPSTPGQQLPSSSDFARALSALPKTNAPPPPVSFARKKPVKKVRVQSPPPSSPESAGHEHTYPKYPLPPRDPDEDSSVASGTDDDVNGEKENPFQNEDPPLPQDALAGLGMPGSAFMGSMAGLTIQTQPPPTQPYTGRGPPPNPFQKTLEDMERDVKDDGSSLADQASAGKAGMDVEAFKRLLLTGQGRPAAQAGDAGSITESSSISRQSISDATNPTQDTPRTSHEVSEPEADEDKRSLLPSPKTQRSGSRKKPPPPPAARHGRAIRSDKEKDERKSSAGFQPASPTSPRPSSSGSPTDVNKPLPPPPDRSEDDAKNSIFDKEAAGKVPELDVDPEADVVPPPRPPTPPNASHSASTPVQNPQTSTAAQAKPAAPPRRRQGSAHKRSESTAHDDETTPSRASFESQLSRTSSSRHAPAAPAPPPPRRQPSSGGHRQSPSFSTASAYHNHSTTLPAGPTSPGSDDAGSVKLSPPPVPPQRNASLRRGANSSSSIRTAAKGAGAAPPPPPPPRMRGSSKGSIDGPALTHPASTDNIRRVSGGGDFGAGSVAPVAEEETDGVAADASDDAVRAMLADLDALQREVDAARAAAGGP